VSSERRKSVELASRPARCRVLRGSLLVGLTCLGGLSACGLHSRAIVVSARALERAPAAQPSALYRAVVTDTARLEPFYYPLGRRLGLVQIKNADEWEALRAGAPELGPPPNFSRGIVVGLASRTGMPIDGMWPIHIESVRVYEGAGFAIARFDGGSFLPDGTTYLETAQIDGLAAVLMVEINGLRFYPE
jgi:hypothetical protein